MDEVMPVDGWGIQVIGGEGDSATYSPCTVTYEVMVTRLQIKLVRVDYPGGHQIVVGGRLLSTTGYLGTVPRPDMPVYTADMFPVDFQEWANGAHPEVRVYVYRNGEEHKLGAVRANTLLFTERSKEAVTCWLKGQADENT